MGASEIIAVIALIVSIASAWVSYRAHRYTVRARQQEADLSFSREKSEFLVRIDKARKLFDGLEHRLKSQLKRIDGAPDAKQKTLATEAAQINSELGYLEGCQRQIWSLWHETYEMGRSGLAHHKPRFLGLIEDDERFAEKAMISCDQRDERITNVCKEPTFFVV